VIGNPLWVNQKHNGPISRIAITLHLQLMHLTPKSSPASLRTLMRGAQTTCPKMTWSFGFVDCFLKNFSSAGEQNTCMATVSLAIAVALLELFDRVSTSSCAACSTLRPLPSDLAENVVTRFLQEPCCSGCRYGADMDMRKLVKALLLMRTRTEKSEEKPEGNDSRHLRRVGKESCRGRTR